MKLQSNIVTKKSDFSIDYNDSLLFLGSCFGENVSKTFSKRKFKTLSNPFGIIFNPLSIFDNINQALNNKVYTSNDIEFHQEIYSCFDFHSDLSSLSEDEILHNINNKIKETNSFLLNTSILFITLGTAWVYELNTESKESKIVANCHKFPSSFFEKRLLNPHEILEKANQLISRLQTINKELKIVFTISPVRHLKDGFIENNQSKSVLHLAVRSIIESNENTSYFPAYEYVIDELRDYRFFKKDFVHPNELAVQYVLEKFDSTYLDSQKIELINKIEAIHKAIEHKVKFKETKAHQKFQANILSKIKELEAKGFDFSEEKRKLFK